MTEGTFRGMSKVFSPITRGYGDHSPHNSITFSAVSAVNLQLDTSRFHIALPVKGSEPYQVDGHDFVAGENEYFIFNPKQKALCYGTFQSEVEGICIFLTPETLQETAQSMQLGLEKSLEHPFPYDWQGHEFLVKTYALQENEFGKYLAILKEKLLAVKREDLVWEDETVLYSQIAEAFLKGHYQIGNHLNNIPALKSATKGELYKRLANVHAFIAGAYHEKIQIEDLLQIGCLSKFHLIRTYKQVYGNTPYQDILHRRLSESKKLIKEGLAQNEIAFRLHFTDGKAFGKAFKKKFGFTVGQQREK
ncbi:MAG: helix-turn-helix transcriptional regulator [Saprospiraceae bacterium]|nr:helix-turn-helix transcriptional regulator [Saprospiraceae bacterium]